MSGKSQTDPFGGQTMGSETIVEALQEVADNENVKAIVLRINSPGGSALASDLIWRATKSIDKPIVASMGDVAASGGYMMAAVADKIMLSNRHLNNQEVLGYVCLNFSTNTVRKGFRYSRIIQEFDIELVDSHDTGW